MGVHGSWVDSNQEHGGTTFSKTYFKTNKISQESTNVSCFWELCHSKSTSRSEDAEFRQVQVSFSY